MFICRKKHQIDVQRDYRFPYRLLSAPFVTDLNFVESAFRVTDTSKMLQKARTTDKQGVFAQVEKIDVLISGFIKKKIGVGKIEVQDDVLFLTLNDTELKWGQVEKMVEEAFCLKIVS